MSSNIDQIIEEIEDYIEGCKFQPLSSTKIIVNKDEIQELIADLRQKTPEEVKRYQKIISNKEAILADAQSKADTIISQAQIQKDELVSEHLIMQQAYAQADQVVSLAQKQAQEIMDEATNDANEIRMGAIAYADRMLKAIEDLLAGSQNIFKTNFAQLSTSMQKTLDVVTANRAELAPAESYGENAAMEEAAPDSAENAPVSDGPVQ
ncbi:MAG: ATPase [Eubacterium sp.]|nr:ATPase [Eubacterium sp.]